jgi:hypothetical protein
VPRSNEQRENKIDEALKETFPASDAPSFVGAGAEPEKRKDCEHKSDFGKSRYIAIRH